MDKNIPSNISIRLFFSIIGGVLSLLLIAICVLVYSLFAQYNKWLQVEKEKTSIQIKADELRQSSDDLTRLARLYAMTGKQEYADNYQQVLDIRSGKIPRPHDYQHIYWDLTPEMREERHPPGDKESLAEQFEQLPLLKEEKQFLITSEKNSNDLAKIEVSVFAVIADPAADETQITAARNALFSDQYQKFKNNIMLPIDDMLASLDSRYLNSANHLSKDIFTIFAVFGVVLAIFMALLLLTLLFVRRKVLNPVHHLIGNIHSIQRGSDMDRRVFYHDEIGLLTRQFYSMKEQMDRNYHDMQMVSFTDSLTELYNRHYFFQMAAKQFKISERNKQKMSLIICDVDHFKAVNDTHGHLVGDEALKHVAKLINASVRESDMCARFGGEEFVVLLNNTTINHGLEIAEKIRSNLEQSPCIHNDITLRLTISIGVSQVGDDGNINEAIDQADTALYDAKNNGRNQVRSA